MLPFCTDQRQRFLETKGEQAGARAGRKNVTVTGRLVLVGNSLRSATSEEGHGPCILA